MRLETLKAKADEKGFEAFQDGNLIFVQGTLPGTSTLFQRAFETVAQAGSFVNSDPAKIEEKVGTAFEWETRANAHAEEGRRRAAADAFEIAAVQYRAEDAHGVRSDVKRCRSRAMTLRYELKTGQT